MKKSFSILELVVVISLLALLYTLFLPKNKINYLDELTNRIELYISYTRQKALIDEKYDLKDSTWHRKRWTIKFFRCRESEGGLYYSIFSDNNKSGHPSAEDSLKDPLSGKNIYSSNQCKENSSNSKYVLLTKNFKITDNYHGEKFFVKIDGKTWITPLFVVLIFIEFTDLIFAVDSIPAIFAVTTDPFIVYTSNIFAILGLRALYFILVDMADRFELLKYGLAIILMFIGVKLLIMEFFKIPILLSLGFVIGVLVISIIASIKKTSKKV